MKRLMITCFAMVCFGSAAWAQCNPSIPGTCGINDPALAGQQQLEQNRATQQLEMRQQNQQLQNIERDNARRYEQQQQQLLQDRGPRGAAVPQAATYERPVLHRHKAKRPAATRRRAQGGRRRR